MRTVKMVRSRGILGIAVRHAPSLRAHLAVSRVSDDMQPAGIPKRQSDQHQLESTSTRNRSVTRTWDLPDLPLLGRAIVAM